MKKIMILAGVAMFTIASQAATVKWLGQNAYEMGSTTTKAAGYVAYFINTADYAYSSALTDLSKGDYSFVESYGAGEKAFSSGAATATISSSAGNSETWEGYLVIFNAATTDDASYAFLSTTASATTGASGQAATVKFSDLTGTQSASNWHAVPEPTSGLLMLLGMAGLALRRRRA